MPQSWAHSYLYLILLLIYYSTCSFNLISMHLTISLAGAHYGIWIIVGTLDGFPHHRRASNQCTGTITARECRRSSGSKPCAIYSLRESLRKELCGWLVGEIANLICAVVSYEERTHILSSVQPWSCLLVEARALSFLGCVIFGFSRVVKAVKERSERNGMMGWLLWSLTSPRCDV